MLSNLNKTLLTINDTYEVTRLFERNLWFFYIIQSSQNTLERNNSTAPFLFPDSEVVLDSFEKSCGTATVRSAHDLAHTKLQF